MLRELVGFSTLILVPIPDTGIGMGASLFSISFVFEQKCSLSSPRGLTDESEILKFLQHGTLVGLLPVPHPILIRKYQANAGTAMWFRTYMWGVIYLR